MKENEKTIEELEAEYNKIANEYKIIGEQLKKKKQEEEERKRAELALKKDRRTKEIEELENKLVELKREYIKDYGSYAANRTYSSIADVCGWLL